MTALGEAILLLRQTGQLNRAFHAAIEAMTLFASFVEKGLRLPRLDDLKADHINEFIQLPVIRKPGCRRSIEEVRRIRKDGALLFLSRIAESEIDPRKQSR